MKFGKTRNEDSATSMDERRYQALVIYDIVDNRRRNHVAKCLDGYGVRVQKSAFEVRLTRKLYDAMENKLSGLIDRTEDSLRIYRLSAGGTILSWGIGAEQQSNAWIG